MRVSFQEDGDPPEFVSSLIFANVQEVAAQFATLLSEQEVRFFSFSQLFLSVGCSPFSGLVHFD